MSSEQCSKGGLHVITVSCNTVYQPKATASIITLAVYARAKFLMESYNLVVTIFLNKYYFQIGYGTVAIIFNV